MNPDLLSALWDCLLDPQFLERASSNAQRYLPDKEDYNFIRNRLRSGNLDMGVLLRAAYGGDGFVHDQSDEPPVSQRKMISEAVQPNAPASFVPTQSTSRAGTAGYLGNSVTNQASTKPLGTDSTIRSPVNRQAATAVASVDQAVRMRESVVLAPPAENQEPLISAINGSSGTQPVGSANAQSLDPKVEESQGLRRETIPIAVAAHTVVSKGTAEPEAMIIEDRGNAVTDSPPPRTPPLSAVHSADATTRAQYYLGVLGEPNLLGSSHLQYYLEILALDHFAPLRDWSPIESEHAWGTMSTFLDIVATLQRQLEAEGIQYRAIHPLRIGFRGVPGSLLPVLMVLVQLETLSAPKAQEFVESVHPILVKKLRVVSPASGDFQLELCESECGFVSSSTTPSLVPSPLLPVSSNSNTGTTTQSDIPSNSPLVQGGVPEVDSTADDPWCPRPGTLITSQAQWTSWSNPAPNPGSIGGSPSSVPGNGPQPAAGSIGFYYEVNGETYMVTNAHVVASQGGAKNINAVYPFPAHRWSVLRQYYKLRVLLEEQWDEVALDYNSKSPSPSAINFDKSAYKSTLARLGELFTMTAELKKRNIPADMVANLNLVDNILQRAGELLTLCDFDELTPPVPSWKRCSQKQHITQLDRHWSDISLFQPKEIAEPKLGTVFKSFEKGDEGKDCWATPGLFAEALASDMRTITTCASRLPWIPDFASIKVDMEGSARIRNSILIEDGGSLLETRIRSLWTRFGEDSQLGHAIAQREEVGLRFEHDFESLLDKDDQGLVTGFKTFDALRVGGASGFALVTASALPTIVRMTDDAYDVLIWTFTRTGSDPSDRKTALMSGDSGGPLVDANGALLGLNSCGLFQTKSSLWSDGQPNDGPLQYAYAGVCPIPAIRNFLADLHTVPIDKIKMWGCNETHSTSPSPGR